MLYDPRWEKTKPDVWSIGTLIGWLETQRPEREYDYYDARSCLLAEYLRAHGVVECVISNPYHIPDHFKDVVSTRCWTYGDALERARAALRKQADEMEKLAGVGDRQETK